MGRSEGERPLNVIQGRVDSLTVYEVTEDELELLKHGPASSIYLNLAIAFLPLSLGFFASIFTIDFESLTKFVVFLVIAFVSLVAGVITLIIWFFSRGSYGAVIRKIKSRTEQTPNSVAVSAVTTPDGVTVLTAEEE